MVVSQPLDRVGILLAGGRSVRFGEDKAFYRSSAEAPTWVEKTAAVLLPLCNRVVISANHEQLTRMKQLFANESRIQVVEDLPGLTDYGPIGGLYAAITQIGTAASFLILAVDYPFMTTKILAQLAATPNCYATTPSQSHYLIAHLPDFQRAIEPLIQRREHRVRLLMENLATVPLAFPPSAAFTNQNKK
ncbi:molybdenum cofactor guanylyltransferase [Listeria costaricensis]|uniref:molybdenum cofactor guanylyltransferase n=1 Tax=Listeria costaricensis TaxID=2026604 RepID=UPI000C0762B8|nr:molybdenum cofactor guanylyltransferase [Listeria costaricensis]